MIEVIKKHNLFFRQLIFLGILILMGVVMMKELQFFIGSFLGALVFYIVFRRPMIRMVEEHGWPPWLAALAIVLAICAVLMGLGYLVFEMLANEMQNIDVSQLSVMAGQIVPQINDFVGFELVSRNMIEGSSSLLAKIGGSAVNTTYSFAANIFMTIIILYFMLAHARRLEDQIVKYIPFSGESRAVLLEDITSIIYSNAVGIPLMMLAQGIVAILVYWLFGLPNLVFWAFLTALCGLIPMVGTIIVSVPLGIWFVVDGEVWKGILLMLCGLLVIANVDNLARIVLNKKISNTHPLIVIFGVILGIPLFGFWGIIFGPLMISIFLLLVRIYYKEYKLFDRNPVPKMDDPVAEKVRENEAGDEPVAVERIEKAEKAEKVLKKRPFTKRS